MKRGFIAVLAILVVLALVFALRRSKEPALGAGSMIEPTPEEGPFEEGRYSLFRFDEEIGWATYVLSRGVGQTFIASGRYEVSISPTTDIVIRGETSLVLEEETNIPLSYEGITFSFTGSDQPVDTVSVACRFHSGMADVVVSRKSGTFEDHVALRPGFVAIENFGYQILALAAKEFWELDLQTVHTSVFFPSSQEQGELHFVLGSEETIEIGDRSVACRIVTMDVTVKGRTSSYTFWIDADGNVQKIDSRTQGIVAFLQSVSEV